MPNVATTSAASMAIAKPYVATETGIARSGVGSLLQTLSPASMNLVRNPRSNLVSAAWLSVASNAFRIKTARQRNFAQQWGNAGRIPNAIFVGLGRPVLKDDAVIVALGTMIVSVA